MDYIIIEYWNDCDAFDILYHKGFRNRIYLDAWVSKPEYPVVEEGAENADGEFIPSFQKWQKKYRIEVYAQEYLVDALTLMALHNNIYVRLKVDEVSKVSNVEVDVDWDDTIECFAKVTISFNVDYVINTNCCEIYEECCVDYRYECDGFADADVSPVWTDPASYPNQIYFFYNTESGQIYSGADLGVYKSIDGEWVEQDMENYQHIYILGTILVKYGLTYVNVPYISEVTDEGGGVGNFRGFAICENDTFVQLQYYDTGAWIDVGDPFFSYQFAAGHDVTTGAGTFTFRVKWYTHSCVMGYSNHYDKTIT